MTDLAHTPALRLRRSAIRLPALPSFEIGPALDRISNALGAALNMAYVDPFQPRRAGSAATVHGSDEDLAGRDPNW